VYNNDDIALEFANAGLSLISTTGITQDVYQIAIVRRDGSDNLYAYVNGSDVTAGAPSEANDGDFDYLGNGSLYYESNLGEVLYYGSDLSTADREQVETYLATKWGITLS
jgi:hypothetical protein